MLFDYVFLLRHNSGRVVGTEFRTAKTSPIGSLHHPTERRFIHLCLEGAKPVGKGYSTARWTNLISAGSGYASSRSESRPIKKQDRRESERIYRGPECDCDRGGDSELQNLCYRQGRQTWGDHVRKTNQRSSGNLDGRRILGIC